ncbi:hypothetical protein ACFL35_06710 [Candidatus Riflebacteria bacterium]
MEVKSCKRCSTIFQKISRDICPKCLEAENFYFEKIKKYLKKKKTMDIKDLMEKTGASLEVIQFYISSGKMEAEFGKGLISYSCSMCGGEIKKGLVCNNCDKDLRDQILDLRENIKNGKLRKKYVGHDRDNILTKKD